MPARTINGRIYEEVAVYASTEDPLPVDIGAGEVNVYVDTVEVPGLVTTVVAARTPTTTSVASSATGTELVAANLDRKGISIANLSSAKLYLSFDESPSTSNAFVVLQPEGFLLLDQQCITTAAITGIWASENGTAQVTEFV